MKITKFDIFIFVVITFIGIVFLEKLLSVG